MVMSRACHNKKMYFRWVYVTVVLIVVSIPLVVMSGSVAIPLNETVSILLSHIPLVAGDSSINAGVNTIIWELRLPRALLACIAGAGFALAGTTLQVATRNTLAEPHVLGVSSGAVLGAVIATLHAGEFLFGFSLPAFAFAGALLATICITLINRYMPSSSSFTLLMSGVAISFVFTSLANLLLFLGDHRAAHQVIFWMLGGFGLARWENILLPFSVCFIAYIYLMYQSNRMNALLLGDETAHSLGISIHRLRLQLFICSAMVTAVLVASCGAIGFVGLVMPHIARSLVGGNTRRVLTLSALLGALFLSWADLLARLILSPEELPIGILTGLLGGIFFLFILAKKPRQAF
ncbi:MAG: iron complex transport system permease protein [Cellvibrionaceae bacterium]|jgi:iron complex transport system permease protein